MKIDRMEEGALYTIKASTVISHQSIPVTGPSKYEQIPVLKGWRDYSKSKIRAPFIYLGWKQEDWTYSYQNTNKVHYVLWKEKVWVMDNQFAKHVEPVWSEDCHGQD
tara:strand:- start:936 stop:1256 length:321 start_codon:yes stop_codon:yes gene_type:complete